MNSPKSLKTVGEIAAEAQQELAKRARYGWGHWHFEHPHLVFVSEGGEERYEIDLLEAATSAHVLDWVFQVHGKTWVTDRDMRDLLQALREILDPQATLCSFGASLELSRSEREGLLDSVTMRANGA